MQYFEAIAELLKAEKLPTLTAIEEYFTAAGVRPPKSTNDACPNETHLPTKLAEEAAAYRRVGGTVEPIFEKLFSLSKEKDEKCGDDTFHWNSKYETEYPALPRCRNDSEYGFVRKMLAN